MIEIENLLNTPNISGYLHPIHLDEKWPSFRDPAYPVHSASCHEARFNRSGQIAYYIASGDDTAKLNVKGWEQKIRCGVAPQTINCFDLPTFSKDHGIYEEFLHSKEEGGYPLPQTAADYLLSHHGITGILYASYPDYIAGRTGCCIVIRSQDGKLVDEKFFVSGTQTG